MYAFYRFVAESVNSCGCRARGRTGAVALRTALFTPTLRIYVSLRNVIPSRNDKINSKRRSLQIAARASTEFAEVPRKSAERTRAFELLHGGGNRGNGGRRKRKTGRDGDGEREGLRGRGRKRERLEGERIYLNISGNLGTKHASAGVISSPHATEMRRVR